MSVRIYPGQETVVYPPNPGDPDGPCVQPCGHIDCILASQDAAKLCPDCKQPLGFGCVQHVEWTEPTQTVWSGFERKTIALPAEPKITMLHLACWEVRKAAESAAETTEDAQALS